MADTAGFPLIFGIVVLGNLLLILVAFAVLTRVFSATSGWRRLADLYSASYQPEGTTFRHQHMRMGVVRYRNCATITVTAEGMHLAVSAPVIGQHPPLLIPWSAVSGVRATRLYWLGARQLDIGRPVVASVVVLSKVYDAMKPYLARWLPGSAAL